MSWEREKDAKISSAIGTLMAFQKKNSGNSDISEEAKKAIDFILSEVILLEQKATSLQVKNRDLGYTLNSKDGEIRAYKKTIKMFIRGKNGV